MTRWHEDEIPTRPGIRSAHTDIHNTLGLVMAEVINLRKRIEVLESLEIRSKIKSERPSGTGTDFASMAIVAKKAIQWGILVIAGIISALKELGYLKP
jgi:ribosomal protein L14